MKNIEKYPNTKDALEAYNSLYLKRVPFDTWLECEFEEPRLPTLLEAAEAVTTAWRPDDGCDINTDSLERCLKRLSEAVKREQAKPVRNCDRYKTAYEAFSAYSEACQEVSCLKCPFDESRNNGVSCGFNFLYAEAGKGETK